MRARADQLALAAVAVAAAAYAFGVVAVRARAGEGLAHFDTYAYFYPNARYALDALAHGEGLLWNRFQNCGQPFLAITLVAALYPLHWLLLLVGIDRALVLLFAIHLLIGGAGAYGLGRALRLRPAAALCGALTFELGWTTLFLGYWSPMTLAVYAWLPGALAVTELLLRRATRRRCALLAVLLGLQWLAGYPQVSIFTCQLIALRTVWECATRWRRRLLASVAAIAAAGLLAGGLAAVQLVPGAEVAAHSLRSRVLEVNELRPPGVTTTWASLREMVGRQVGYGAAVGVGTAALAALALARRGRRRIAACYALAGALGAALAFDNPVFEIYRHLPFGSAFREPNRFLWVTAFAASVLAAIGADALLRGSRRAVVVSRPALAALAGLAMAWLSTSSLQPRQWAAIAAVVALAAAAAWRPARRALAVALPILVAVELWFAGGWQLFAYRADDEALWSQRAAFEQVRAHMTPQRRMYQIPSVNSAGWGGLEDGVLKKAGQLYRIPSIIDYEPQTSARYAELIVRMLWNKPMRTINQFYFEAAHRPRSLPLLNLTAARFIVMDAERASRGNWPDSRFPLLWEENGERIYENPSALPRARVVPHAVAIADPAVLLEALANAQYDPRTTVLLEGGPGEVGGSGEPGQAAILSDMGEDVVLRVAAAGPSFLVLADQDYPGWTATVNGVAEPILRADYAFRAVAVPAGRSQVEFHYRPRSLWIGLAATIASVIVLVVLAWRR